VWRCGRGGQEQQKKREERDEVEEQHDKQLEEISLLQSSPCKPTMVVKVCCHCHELSIVMNVCCLHQDFLSPVLKKKFAFIYFSYFFFAFNFFFPVYLLVFVTPFFRHFNFF
jgi:hypothetical protein